MADDTPAPAIKTVPKPRDQHLRDLADCIRFLSMDAVQQAKSVIAPVVWVQNAAKAIAAAAVINLNGDRAGLSRRIASIARSTLNQ